MAKPVSMTIHPDTQEVFVLRDDGTIWVLRGEVDENGKVPWVQLQSESVPTE